MARNTSPEARIITQYVESDPEQAKRDLAEMQALPYSIRTTAEYAASITVLSKTIRRVERRNEQLAVKQDVLSPIMALATSRVASRVELDRAALAGTLTNEQRKATTIKATEAIARRIQQAQASK